METRFDKSSQLINTSVNFIFIKHPTRTSLGIVLGIVINILTKLFSPILNRQSAINLSTIEPWEFIIFGVFLLHLRTFYELITKKISLSENEEKAFELIRTAKARGQITEWEAKDL